MRMRKGSTMQCTQLRFWVPLLLLASFSYAPSVLATTQISGNEVNTNGKVVNAELAKPNLQGHDEEAKFKGFIPKPIPIVKPIPIIKPVPKIIPVVKPIPIPVYKPVPKPIPVVKPIPIIKPVPKIIPIVKPIPIIKPVPKPIPIIKPIPKPFIVKKPIPAVESEEFLKPKPFFKKPIPKLPLHPKFEKPHLPHLPIHKPIPTP